MILEEYCVRLDSEEGFEGLSSVLSGRLDFIKMSGSLRLLNAPKSGSLAARF